MFWFQCGTRALIPMKRSSQNEKLQAAAKLYKDELTFVSTAEILWYFKMLFPFQVDNVARFLFYMDPSAPSLAFVLEKEKTKQYIRDLSEANLMKQTQINYLKNIKVCSSLSAFIVDQNTDICILLHHKTLFFSFLKFHTYNTNLKLTDLVMHGHCEDFIKFLDLQQAKCSTLVSKEITRKRQVDFFSSLSMHTFISKFVLM